MSRFKPKLVNDPLEAANELLEGMVFSYNGRAKKVGTRSIALTDIPQGKVALLVGGGAGHEPIYHGFVGENVADGAACGDIFAAPAPQIVFEAAQEVNRGSGVLFLYGNYAGDTLNFDLGAEMVAELGVQVRTVLIADDVASASPERKTDRRGIAGQVLIVKIVGAASQTAQNLEELVEVAERVCLQTRSLGVAMAPGSIPGTGKPTFELEEGKIGLGMGIHGEEGVGTLDFMSADELSVKMLDLIFADYQQDTEVDDLKAGDEILFFVNSLGATTMMECLICLRQAKAYLEEKGIKVYDVLVGPVVTCQEMAGLSFSITRVDEEMKSLWSMPCQSLCISKMQGPEAQGKEANFSRRGG